MARLRYALSLVVAFGLLVPTALGIAAQDDKPTVSIGSKDFTEQVLVNEMLALLLEDAGYEVERQFNLASTAVVHAALLSGEVDTYIEYTGTALIATLGLELPAVAATPTAGSSPATPAAGGDMVQAVYDIVKAEYAAQFDVAWLDPLGFNNTYALAMTRERAEELGVTTISDLIPLSGDLAFGATQECLTREDCALGLPGTYAGLEFGEERGLDPGLVYSAVDEGDVDVITAFATDGRIPALDLVILEDDAGFFPPYFAAPIVRQDLLDEDPAVADVLNQLAGQIDDATMADLNFQVDDGGEDETDVAQAFLEERGLLGE